VFAIGVLDADDLRVPDIEKHVLRGAANGDNIKHSLTIRSVSLLAGVAAGARSWAVRYWPGQTAIYFINNCGQAQEEQARASDRQGCLPLLGREILQPLNVFLYLADVLVDEVAALLGEGG